MTTPLSIRTYSIALTCVLASLSASWASETSGVTSSAAWYQTEYEPLGSLKAVPPAVLKALRFRIPSDHRLADQGESFIATDVIGPTLPRRRFVFGGKSARFVLICYEHGGRHRHFHLAVFVIGNKAPQLVFAGRSNQRLQSIEAVKELVGQGALSNEVGAKQQEW